jgi:hypothetical protein
MNLLFCLVMEYHGITRKKMTETASLRVAHDAKFPSFFFSGDSSITKQNK